MLTLWRRLEPYVLLTILALPALWPSAGRGIPRTNDNLPHLFRTVELDQLVRAGIFFPRWAPHLVFGFGYPIFDFFPYEAHYLVEALHFGGLSFPAAYNLAGALALLASGVFAFQLGREHFGEIAGLVAGAAYLYSPYLLYDTYVRGSLPESLALALLPLALLHLRRAVRGDHSAVAWAGLALGAAIFAHPGVMLQAMPLVGGYAVWEMASGNWQLAIGRRKSIMPTTRIQLRISNYALLVTPFILSLALSAFFWLPALAEARYVQTARGTSNGPMNYANNLMGLDQLLALPRLPVDADLLNPPVVRSLPLAALALAGLAVARWSWRRTRPLGAREQAWSIGYISAAALVATLAMHPIAKPLWDAVPLLQLTLFPWRLLGPVSLFIALVAGSLVADEVPLRETKEENTRHSSLVARRGASPFMPVVIVSIALVLLIVAGLPFATPPREAVTANPTLANLAAFEVPPDFIGTTTVGEYLPAWVRQLPDVSADRQRLAHGESVARFDAPGATVQPGPARPIGATFTVQAPQTLNFVYRTFYFPGWRAILDGQSAPITITSPEGLIAVEVPPGTHSLVFEFGSTPPRTLADALSIVGLLVVAAWLAWPRLLDWRAGARDRARLPLGGLNVPENPGKATPASKGKGRWLALPLFALAIILALARPLLYDGGRTPLLRHGLAAQPPAVAARPLDLSFSGELHLWGADLPARPVAAGAPVAITLYWQAEHHLGVDYGFDLRLVDPAGHTWTERGWSRPADWRFSPGTDLWPAGQYILDPYVLTLLPGTPPGVYTAEATVFARYNQQGIGTKPVGTVAIGSPARNACPNNRVVAAAPGVQLRETAIEPAAAAPGDEVTLSLCWLAVNAPRVDLRGQVRLADASGMMLAAQSFNLGGSYPASRWAAGDVLRDQVTVLLPAALTTGNYTWSASVDGGQTVALGAESVTAPARSYIAPQMETGPYASLGPITLFGVNGLTSRLAPGADLKLTLAWRANQTLSQSYHVFVHLQNADGVIVAQSDGVPADWTRRTTGWLTGEFVIDARTLRLPPDLPSGDYTLFAGLYRPDTGERLSTQTFPDGQIPLGATVIGN